MRRKGFTTMKRMQKTMLLLGGLASTLLPAVAAADGLREDEVAQPTDLLDIIIAQPTDCRKVFPALTPVVHGLNYSAIGWVREPADNPSRKVTITAQAGRLVNGVFTADSSAAVEVLSACSGTGVCDWVVSSLPRRVYRLVHAVTENGVADDSGQLIGYIDNSFCSTEAGGLGEWAIAADSGLEDDAISDVRVDLQEGEVRSPQKLAYVLPFVYSPTNFTGDIAGRSSRVSIVQLTGDDPDVTKWTEEVSGTARVLKEATDEGEVKWRAKKGVWRATFEIFDGEVLKDTQIKYFDLRNATGSGLVLFVT